jgi:hypothetical protein
VPAVITLSVSRMDLIGNGRPVVILQVGARLRSFIRYSPITVLVHHRRC